jgi:serine/threonine protein kinase
MVGTNGIVKVLDFGLAKLTATEGSADATHTIKGHTEEGAIVGTAAYTCPEQAQAKPVDGRSDIFSFGSVLYEMIAYGKNLRFRVPPSPSRKVPRSNRELGSGVAVISVEKST